MNNKSNILLTIVSIIMFIIGLVIFFYPTISNFVANKNFENIIGDYEDIIKEIPKEDFSLEYDKAVTYNKALVGDPVYDPFIPGSGYQIPENYNEVLNLKGDGVMGYIEIPKISLKIPIYHTSSEKVLEHGVGHLETSALPIGGVGNNPILTGHRGLPRAELFTRLDELKNKDKIYIYVLNDILAYEVDNVMIMKPEELVNIAAYRDKDMITLITCTPYGVNTHRLVVQGHRIEYIPEEKEKIKANKIIKLSESFIIRAIGVPLGLLILFIIFYVFNKRKKNNKSLNINNQFKEVVKEKVIEKPINNKKNTRKEKRKKKNSTLNTTNLEKKEDIKEKNKIIEKNNTNMVKKESVEGKNKIIEKNNTSNKTNKKKKHTNKKRRKNENKN